MDPLNLSSSVWPLEGEDDLGLRWCGGANSGLPTDRTTSSLDPLDYGVQDPLFFDLGFQSPPFLPAGSQLEQEVVQLRVQNAELMKENEFLKAQCSALRERIDFAESAATDAANFPHVKFWFRSDWLSNKEVKEFVETESGDIVNRDRMKEIRLHARQFFMSVKSSAPPQWKQATTEMKQKYYKTMADEFPELRLCHNNWKADQIANDHYHSFYSYHVKRLKDQASKQAQTNETKPPKRRKTTSSISNRLGLPVASSLENIELTGWQVMSGLPIAVTPSSEPIAGSSTFRYGQAPQAKAMSGLPIAVTPSSEPVAGSSTFGYGQAPQANDVFTLSFLESQGTGLPALNDLLSDDEWKMYGKHSSEKQLAEK